jgi:hypothetical protein
MGLSTFFVTWPPFTFSCLMGGTVLRLLPVYLLPLLSQVNTQLKAQHAVKENSAQVN